MEFAKVATGRAAQFQGTPGAIRGPKGAGFLASHRELGSVDGIASSPYSADTDTTLSAAAPAVPTPTGAKPAVAIARPLVVSVASGVVGGAVAAAGFHFW